MYKCCMIVVLQVNDGASEAFIHSDQQRSSGGETGRVQTHQTGRSDHRLDHHTGTDRRARRVHQTSEIRHGSADPPGILADSQERQRSGSESRTDPGHFHQRDQRGDERSVPKYQGQEMRHVKIKCQPRLPPVDLY